MSLATVSPSSVPLQMLDADIVIDLQRKHPAAVAWFAAVDVSAVAVPGFVAMEMTQSARNAREAASADAILRRLVRVWGLPPPPVKPRMPIFGRCTCHTAWAWWTH